MTPEQEVRKKTLTAEQHRNVNESLELQADAARARVMARNAMREKLKSLVGKVVIIEKKGVANTCCGFFLEGELKPHEDGMGSFVVCFDNGNNSRNFYGFYVSSVVEILEGGCDHPPVILLQ